MPQYLFECPAGHTTERGYPYDSCPVTTVCGCGKEARKIVAPCSIIVSGNGWHDPGHDLALARAREKNEWAIATGGDVELSETDGRSPDALATAPRPSEVAKKRDKYRETGKVPQRLAYLTKGKPNDQTLLK